VKKPRYAALGVLAAVVWFGLAPRVSAEDVLQEVRDLYASAAYEAALTTIATLEDSASRPEIDQYRVLCLVALGRSGEAERAVEQLLTKNPLYRPLASDTPPRIQDLFTGVRRRLGPSIARKMYLDGKGAFERKDRETAVRIFEELARVSDDRDLRDDPTIGEIRLLVGGFLTLSKALNSAEPVDRAEPIIPVSPVSVQASAAATTVTSPPVAIQEDLPAWKPIDSASRTTEFRGALRVSITATGTVASAELVRPVHPVYDQLLLRAAKAWNYEPGRVNGQAVPSERIVNVVLKPRR
jgi:TonB family protein